MVTNVFAEVFGVANLRDVLRETLMRIDFIESDLKKHRSPDQRVHEIIALGPLACLPVRPAQ